MDFLTKEKIKGEDFKARMDRFGLIVENANGNWDLSDRDENAVRTANAFLCEIKTALERAAYLIDQDHHEDCADQNETFGPHETCECRAIERRAFIKGTLKLISPSVNFPKEEK